MPYRDNSGEIAFSLDTKVMMQVKQSFTIRAARARGHTQQNSTIGEVYHTCDASEGLFSLWTVGVIRKHMESSYQDSVAL